MTDKFTVMLTEQHHLGANRLHFLNSVKSKKSIWALLRLIVVYLGVAIAASYLANGSLERANWVEIVLIGVLVALAILVICYAIGYLTLPRRSKKFFLQQKLLHSPASYSIESHALVAKTSLSVTTLPYSHAFKWLQNKNYFLIYHTENSFQILPTEFMNESMLCNIRTNLEAADCPGHQL